MSAEDISFCTAKNSELFTTRTVGQDRKSVSHIVPLRLHKYSLYKYTKTQ